MGKKETEEENQLLMALKTLRSAYNQDIKVQVLVRKDGICILSTTTTKEFYFDDGDSSEPAEIPFVKKGKGRVAGQMQERAFYLG